MDIKWVHVPTLSSSIAGYFSLSFKKGKDWVSGSIRVSKNIKVQ